MKKLFVLIFAAIFAIAPFAMAETDTVNVTAYDIAAMTFSVTETDITYTITSTDTGLISSSPADLTLNWQYEASGTISFGVRLFGDAQWLGAFATNNGIWFTSDGDPFIASDSVESDTTYRDMGDVLTPTVGPIQELVQMKLDADKWHTYITPGSTVTGGFEFQAILN